MKQSGFSALWALTLGVVSLTFIQVHALDHGINGTLMIFIACAIGSLICLFLGFKAKDIKDLWDVWRGK